MQKTDYQALPRLERLNGNNQVKAHQLCRSDIADRIRYECWKTIVNTRDKATKREKVCSAASYFSLHSNLSNFRLYRISTFYNLPTSLPNINYDKIGYGVYIYRKELKLSFRSPINRAIINNH